MAHQKLTKEYWESKSEIIESAYRGWNPLQRLPVLLREAYPDLKGVEFGFFTDADLPERFAQGWELLSTDLFDPDELNEVLPARYGLTVNGGRIKWSENTLMIMGKDFREQLIDARNRSHEDRYQAAVESKKYVSPHDPRGDEMSAYAESKLETHQVRPRGPGRPPKKK